MMMRKINKCYLFALLLTISISTLQAQTDTISPKRLSLKGKVKKIEDFSYFLEANPKGKRTIDGKRYNIYPFVEDWNIEKNESKYTKTNISCEFDRTGKNTNLVTYYAEGNPFKEANFVYDLGGKLIKSQTNIKVSDGSFVVNKKYVYDDNKRLVKIDEHDGNQLLKSVVFAYDKLGNCIEKSKKMEMPLSFEEQIQVIENQKDFSERTSMEYVKKETYQYNKAGKVTLSEKSFPEQKVFLRTENEYDKKNKLIRAKFLNEENEETNCSYQYDEKGRLKQTICTAKDNTDFYLEMNIVYKPSGKVETIKTRTDVISKKVFDENGLLKLHRTSEFDHKYRYSFDRKGNWKEAVLYENGIPTKIRVRKIEYY
ncbi:conserved exported hypothetical protein [Capnocytophaga cynodegmi]|uniref:Sugar-binding protein n=3 Tax=Capnocytophaga cynodegmi TaxID=28189 RepID=A0A0B7H7V6_9FLAO|nr:conserved exported hypothetical protein [Capnocytophaga cynodegmi]CEN41968.1 conserved exported hypothetical protein [Capnocytophaga cynodegmi]